MKATAQYMKKLLEIQQREDRDHQRHLQRIKDFDFDTYNHEPEEMPDWAKALREHNNNIRSV